MAFIDINQVQSWKHSSILGGINRIESSGDIIRWVQSNFSNNLTYSYKQVKNYQFITSVTGSGTIGQLSLKLKPPFSEDITTTNEDVIADGGVQFYTYANPLNNQSSDTMILYGAYDSFTNSVIQSTKMHEISFLINGFSEFKGLSMSQDKQPSGWSYNLSSDGLYYSYDWFLSSNSDSISPSYSVGTKNYIAKLIEYDRFNLEFEYIKNGLSTDSIDVYLVRYNDFNSQSFGVPFLKITETSGTNSIIGLTGTNVDGTKNYLVFSSNREVLGTSSFQSSLSNINIYGSYHPKNNRNVYISNSISPTSSISVNIPDAEYSYTSNNNEQNYTLHSKIGNGFFKSGIWENGVWNNGWRDDTESRDFDDVSLSVKTASDVSWQIEIRGSTQSIMNFATGSVVSIGNIIAIDINENRKLLKDYYKIESLGTTGNYSWMRINIDTTFPYRRIEKDSDNHKIKVTKNIWLSGGFFNGYFSGVWNNGLFKGYPLITEMFDTHWIDGLFNGGHINSNYSKTNSIKSIGVRENCSNGFLILEFIGYTGFLSGDYINITINKSTLQFKSTEFLKSYNGVTKIIYIENINGNDIVTVDKITIGKPTITAEIGNTLATAIRYTATSLVQNFKFYDNNISKIKSNDTNISNAVFSFNSWIDVNYDDSRSVTLARDFRSYEPLTGKSINRNNLFGYPTYDILSSSSRFRDSNTLNTKLYKLGTKYKVFNDLIGEYSEFNEPFDPALENIENFYNAGWTFSYKEDNIDFNRTESLISNSNSDSILTQNYIDSGVTGDELYISSKKSGGVLNNRNVNINKSRYSVIEFDLVTYSVPNSEYSYKNELYSISEVGYNGINSIPFTQSTSVAATSIIAGGIFSINSDTLLEGDIDFNTGFEANAKVYNIDKQSDGSFIICGSFSNYMGSGTRMNNICRISSTGILDMTFPSNAAIIQIGTPSFIKPYVVKNVTTQNDKIYLLCNYEPSISILGTNVKSRILRLDTDGDIDNLWPSHIRFDNILTDIVVRPDTNTFDPRYISGTVIVIGAFSKCYNTAGLDIYYINKIITFNSDGNINYEMSLNGSFIIPNNKAFFNADDIPSTLVIRSNNSILIGGKISNYREFNNSTFYIRGLIELVINTGDFFYTVNTDLISSNSLLPVNNKGFLGNNLTKIEGSNTYNFINKIILDSLDRIYIIGNFNSYTDLTSHPSFNLIRLKQNGKFDPTFITGQGLDKPAYDIKLSPDEKFLYIAGSFTKYNSVNVGKVIKIKNSSQDGKLVESVSVIKPLDSIVRAIDYSTTDLIIGGSFEFYQRGQSSIVEQVLLTSSYTESTKILSKDILNISLNLNMTCDDLSKISINLKSPDGRVINVKKTNSGDGKILTDTTFDYSSNINMSSSSQPYTGVFKMDKQNNIGTTGFISDSITLTELVTTDTSGDWIIYINDEGDGKIALHDWYIIIRYKKYINDVSNSIVDLPIIHFSNLNYEINTQPTIGATSNSALQIYKKMSYLPITKNVNHLTSKNSFRLDSIENTSPDRWGGFNSNQKNKKYEYFYNKTDMMLSISGNGESGISQSMVVLDNLNMYEVDMIPFFKYFEESNIYKGIQEPIRGVSPEIDYLNSDFIFVDNISIGLDTIEINTDLKSNLNCTSISISDLITKIKITDVTLDNTKTFYKMINATSSNSIGSVTCSTDFDSISWTFISPFTALIQNKNTLYPTITGLVPNSYYQISVAVTKGNQSSKSSMVLRVNE